VTVSDTHWLAQRFEAQRDHLRAVAYRMLGSLSEAEDAVQETWLRLSRSDSSSFESLGGWLTTVVGRVCLDMLRARKSRRETQVDAPAAAPAMARADGMDPEREALLTESVGLALLVVLEALEPAERVAFVLHDMFDLPFDDIAAILERTPEAARQLASRARRRVQGSPAPADTDHARQREIVTAFLAASRGGDFEALLAVLHPDVVLRADAATVKSGAAPETRGAEAVAGTFKGRALAAQLALVDGIPGAVWMTVGKPRVVFAFTVTDGQVVAIDLIADPERLGEMDLEMLER
jgi:RNA polymerase sigma-70 factor (ECF subfamily)